MNFGQERNRSQYASIPCKERRENSTSCKVFLNEPDIYNAIKRNALLENVTLDADGKIDEAREAYDALTDDQKALITEDAPTIVTAETTYTTLHNNNLAAAEVIALINAIGTVEYTDTSKNKIDAAKEAYNDLTDAQKAIVDNYLTENEVETIAVSETLYLGLEAKANKKLSGGAIAGIVIGCVAFVACVCFLLWFFLFKKKKEDKDEPKNDQTDEPKE